MLVKGSSQTDFADAFEDAIRQVPPNGNVPRTYETKRSWAERGGFVGAMYYVDVEASGQDVEATIIDVNASRDGGRISVTGTLRAPESGWSVNLEADNPGVAGDRDKQLRLVLTATPPEVGADVLTEVLFGDTFSGKADDATVAIRLRGVVDAEGRAMMTVPVV
ncbi:hypothetical protein J7E29_11715 [Streptomyces sp. ISL-90]|nr:hypothetical protein [Streptomyces sp. ISL-90]